VSTALRSIGFLLFWLILAGANPADLPAGVAAALAATWVSLRLTPPRHLTTVRPLKTAQFVLRFFVQAVVAGTDVARRALDPRLPLQPGFVTFRTRLPSGGDREVFCAITSLLPGTLPAGESPDGIIIHCLDVNQPIAAQVAAEEALFIEMLGGARNNG
jgi:multicomponent Na+:H+ antiporter subunit E